MKKIYIIVFVVFSHSCFAINLINGDTKPVDPANLSQSQEKSWGVIWDENLYPDGVTNLGNGALYYLLDNTEIDQFNVSTKQIIGNWKLGAVDPCDAEDASADCESPWWSGRWSSGELLESEVKNLFKWYGGNLLSSGGRTVACMDSNPLRYGDIEGDGKSELVLILNNNWLIFNTDLKKITFLYLLNVADWYSAEDTVAQIGTASEHPDNPQYVSAMASDASYPSKIDSTVVESGHRGYGKLFIGHFESAESNDILEWRKLYKSRLNKDPIKGFEKISDTYAHYKLVNGEYQKQTTPEETIKGWLAAKQLTWQKGYPSKSECPGQEGQLIPEMHDPLLNDPDVLQ